MNKNSFTSVGKTSFCVCASETNTETRRDKKLHFKNKKKKKKRIESYELVATHWFYTKHMFVLTQNSHGQIPKSIPSMLTPPTALKTNFTA